MKKLFALLLIAAMVFTLAACGSEPAPAQTPVSTEPEAAVGETIDETASLEPAANVDPAQLNIGRARDEAHTGDAWYTDGIKGDSYIYFEVADNAQAGLAYVKMEKGERALTLLCAMTEDGHLIDQDAEEGKSGIDIVFYDEFKAYDYANETWYVRGNPDAIEQLFAGMQFVCQDNESNTLSFEADGTGTEVFEGEEDDITWAMDSASTVKYNDGDHDYILEIVTDEKTGALVSLNEQNFRIFLPAATPAE